MEKTNNKFAPPKPAAEIANGQQAQDLFQSDFTLAEIIDIPSVQVLMDDVYSQTGIGMAILDNSGEILISTGWQEICSNFHRIHPETRLNCFESDTILARDI